MIEKRKFEKNELTEVLNSVSENLESEVMVYLIGGLAMIFHGSKAVTKDVDIIIESEADLKIFISACERAGLTQVTELSEEYIDLEAQMVFESEIGIGFDIFHKQVCGGLILTETMKRRSTKVYESTNLTIIAMSREDIFLFKSITLRDDDLMDMATLAGAELDWNTIEMEARLQPESVKWLPRLHERLLELEDEYGVRSPLT